MATTALVEEVVEEVALNLEEVAKVTRKINTAGVGYLLGGIAVGTVIGFYLGHRYNQKKIRDEAFKAADAEIDTIRAVYQAKTIAAEPKPTVEEIIEERGYSTKVTPVERPLPAPVPIHEISEAEIVSVGPVFEPPPNVNPPSVWDYPRELNKRSTEHPYVIHQDEFTENELGYNRVVYTYYDQDDVLTDSDDTPFTDANLIVGVDNLKFGHGTDDSDVVFIRNDKLELDMEICRSPKSYEEEITGLTRDESN